jgi:biopolymer transport protein ExbB
LPEASPLSAPADSAQDYSLYDQFFRGGFWMWPILLCSFIGVAFALERLVNMRRSKVIPPRLLQCLDGNLPAKPLVEVRKACNDHPSCLGRVILAGLERAGMSLAEMERVADEQSQRELYRLRRNSRPLGIVATVAPMFGLLGTVSGMIGAFDLVARHGSLGDPKMLSANIAIALLTTGFGLIVAIPALFLNHYFRGRADDLIVEISDISDHLFIRFEPAGQAESGRKA